MDAYVSEIIAVIDQRHDGKLAELIENLKKTGVEITNVNEEENVVEGSVESHRLKEVSKVPGVEYVRTVFTYAADYPPGDPRDRDGH
jgi:hypothetical protein